VEGEGGHSSMPPKRTAIGTLNAALLGIERHQMPARLVEPVLKMFGALVPEMPFSTQMVFANLWLFGGLVK
jgi:carboxypeptidase PM20D1